MNFGASNGYCYCKNFSARICGIGRQHRCIRQGGIIQRVGLLLSLSVLILDQYIPVNGSEIDRAGPLNRESQYA